MPKRNMKNKITCILPAVIFFLIVLTGCGKRELVWEQEQSRAESKEEILFGSSILQMLSEQDSTPAEESESENMSAAVDEIGFGTDFASTVTTKDVIAYVDVVQNSGFNIDVEIDARAYEGESRYLFLAYNKAGYFVEIYWYSSGSGMAMRK